MTTTKLSKRQLQTVLNRLAKANATVCRQRALLAEHCLAVYGVDPGDVDNDDFLDSCDGASGVTSGMSVDEFDASMRRYLSMAQRVARE